MPLIPKEVSLPQTSARRLTAIRFVLGWIGDGSLSTAARPTALGFNSTFGLRYWMLAIGTVFWRGEANHLVFLKDVVVREAGR